MLGILKHALEATKDLDVFETLLETVVEIMKMTDVDGFFFYCTQSFFDRPAIPSDFKPGLGSEQPSYAFPKQSVIIY